MNKHPEQKEFINGWMNRLKDVENNMNEIVNKGYYRPPYYDDVTPFDKNYTGVLKKIENSDTEQLQKDRNKYQYLLNKKGQDTGFATDINHQFTRQEIGRMTPEEFQANESIIMEQLEKGRILDESLDYTKQFPQGCFYTREDIAKMSSKEYEKHEKDILKQMEKQGIPSEKDLPKGEKSGYSKSQSSGKTPGANSGGDGTSDGHWVTINGNHVLIKD